MESFENQIALKNQTKLEELKRKQKEDQQYLKDMINCFPFGRGGGGAPIRDKNGNIVTMRKDLISDSKYNLMQLNVDDDYNEVWGKNKNYGLINFKNENGYNGFVNNFSRSMSARNNNFNLYNNEMNNNNYDNDQYLNRNFSYSQKINNNIRPRSTIPNYNENVLNLDNQNNEMSFSNLRVTDEFPKQDDYQFINNNIINDYELNKIKNEEQYSRDLLLQIKELENLRLLEKKRKEEEDQKEEERLRKQNEELEKKVEEEKNKITEKQKNIENEKNKIKIRKKKSKLHLLEEEKEEENEEDEEEEEESDEFEKENELKKINEEKINQLEQMEIESRFKLNNELIQLRQQMQEQQNDLYNQINYLKEQTHIANMERFEALKEIEKLKNEISKQRNEEELRKQYIREVLNNNNKIYEKDEFENGENENNFNINLKYDEKNDYNNNINNFDDYEIKNENKVNVFDDYELNNSKKNELENNEIDNIDKEKINLIQINNQNNNRIKMLNDIEKYLNEEKF